MSEIAAIGLFGGLGGVLALLLYAGLNGVVGAGDRQGFLRGVYFLALALGVMCLVYYLAAVLA